eukprot:m.209271 g.209271  ORF g.209271 m.209271 type:complete len:654 (+) comp22092_c1_seq2:148-2109(+)
MCRSLLGACSENGRLVWKKAGEPQRKKKERKKKNRKDAMQPTALVVGGNGHLGRRLVKQLLDCEEFGLVRVFDLTEYTEDRRADVVVGNMLDEAALVRAMEGMRVVFHVAAVVDLAPCPGPDVYTTNVGGTLAVIRACQRTGVGHLIHTSSIDAVYNGQEVVYGTEALLPASDHDRVFNGYIGSKADAERLVLAANVNEGYTDSTGLLTTALRPGHIYGPGDYMVGRIVQLITTGELPVRFGSGLNSYSYVDNCAHAHIQCALAPDLSQVAGKVFFVTDLNINVWDHIKPFVHAVGHEMPVLWVPRAVVYALAWLVDMVCWLLGCVGITLRPDFTRYSVGAVSQNYYFSSEAARAAFGFTPLVAYHESVRDTIEWVRQLDGIPKAPSVALFRLYRLHLLYGLVMLLLGLLLFFSPAGVSSSAFHIVTATAADATIAQTAGLIWGVLGVYSLVASVGRWDIHFFALSYVPKAVTAVLFLGLIFLERLPPTFFLCVVLELLTAAATFALVQRHDEPVTLTPRRDALGTAQLLHSTASGLFAALMTVWPAMVLPLLGVGDEAATAAAALQWGHVMGASEFFMTWMYTASGLYHEAEPFVALSVATRVGAFVFLAVNALLGVCTGLQVMGCGLDFVLACVSWYLLQQLRARRQAKRD